MTTEQPATWVLNSFSLSTLQELPDVILRVRAITLAEAKAVAEGAASAVGHADTASLYSERLGVTVAFDRRSIRLRCGDRALVGQHVGERRPAGEVTLPSDSELCWMLVEVQSAR